MEDVRATEKRRREEQGQKEDKERIKRLELMLEEAERRADESERQRKEERQRADESERHREEERQRADESERQREEERQRADELKRQREEERQRADESERQRKEERQRADELKRRADEERQRADKFEQKLLPLSLQDYLDSCHSLNLAINVVTDPASTTKGDVSNPTGRIYPRQIAPWTTFLEQQRQIWALLAESPLQSETFPNQNQMAYVLEKLPAISCELGLRIFERNTVEDAVRALVAAVDKNPVLRESLGIQGVVTFESHTNLGPPISVPPQGEAAVDGRVTPEPKRRQTQVHGSADQFCIYRASENGNVPVVAIEYKPPHKLSRVEVTTGFKDTIEPDRDVIDKEITDFGSAAKSLAAAVMAQLFSYMIQKCIRFGYICTGETLVFVYIPEDSTTALYHVSVPSLDVDDNDEYRLHYTAVAQVFAFVLQSIRAPTPSQKWLDGPVKRPRWPVEYDDILSKIPLSVRKDKDKHSAYKGSRSKHIERSPIATRSKGCQSPLAIRPHRDEEEDDEHGNSQDPPTSPTPVRPVRPRNVAPAASGPGKGKGKGKGKGRQARNTMQISRASKGGKVIEVIEVNKVKIQDRPYCTHACLLGLASGGPVDAACPNAALHGPKHIGRDQFLLLLRSQLATDRDADADAAPLYLAGSIGSLIKVRLSAYGYTLVAKGVHRENLSFLEDEKKVYDALRPIQGQYVPVCVGLINLVLPYYCHSGTCHNLLLLSWAGRCLSVCYKQLDRAATLAAIAEAYKGMHRLRVLHKDAAPRNIMFDAGSGRLMVADFERSEISASSPPTTPNVKRKRDSLPLAKHQKDAFTKERELAVGCVAELFK